MDATKLPPPAAAAPPPVAPQSDPNAQTIMDGMGQAIAGRFLCSGAGTQTATGRVYEARDTQSAGAVCALELVDPKVLPNPSMADRALRELKQLGKVTSERIVRVLDQGRTSDGQIYVATEAAGGQTLDQLIKAGPLPLERATAIVLQIGEALTEAQKVGVIHRDVSPRNVHVLAGDKVKLSSFGLAEAVNDKVFGAPAYLSPEQVEGRPVDQRSNIYSLGAIFYHALTGTPPFAGDTESLLQQQLNATPQPPSAKKPGLPAEVDRIILKALEKSGGRRHLTLRQLLSEIEAAGHPKAAPAEAAQRTVVADAPPAARPTSQAETAKTMMGIPSPLASVVKPAPATTAPSMPVAAAEPNARTMMAEAPKVTPAAPAPQAPAPQPSMAATMMAEAPKLPTPTSAPATTVDKKPLGASPQVQAAVAAAQAQVAAQKQAAAQAAPAGPTAKGGFRETAWFKAGEIQEELEKAQAKAAVQAGGDVLAPVGTTGQHDAVGAGGEVDLNKVEIDATDKARLSLKTGATQMMQAVKAPQAAVPGERMDEAEMLAEIDNSKRKFMIAGAIVAVVVIAAILFFTLGKKEAPAPGKAELPPPAPTAVATSPPPSAPPTPAAASPTPSPPPPVAAPAAVAPKPTAPAEPPAPTPAQLLAEAQSAAARDNLAQAVDHLTRAVGAGAPAGRVKKLEASLEKQVAKKLATAKKAKDKEGVAEAQALKARLASLKTAKRR